jgi:hypothetical protein
MTAPTPTVRFLEGVHGDRYGEIFLVRQTDAGLHADVYNSYTLGDCPQDLWEALDLAAIAAEEGVLLALPNGPRYWLVDTIEKWGPPSPDLRTFGGITMTRAATLDLGPNFDPSPFTVRRVARAATFSFSAGSTVYELTDPVGSLYVMQSWCTAIDPALTEPDLETLGTRLSLPEGWSFGVRRLDETVRVMTATEDAVVLQDELRNSYCLAR